MKRINYLFLLLGTFLLGGCSESVEETITYKVNEPVFMSADLFRKSVRVTDVPQKINKQGKIAFFQGYMYISEPEKGIHIIDNRNPAKPNVIGFIELLGNADMAIKDNILYADSYIDLVWFDVSSPAQPRLLGRKEEVFPTSVPSIDNNFVCDYEKSMDRNNGIVIGWVVKERTEKYMRERSYWWWWRGGMLEDSAPMANSAYTGGAKGAVGQTGSMSRFAIYKNNLYTVLNNQLGIFNIENPTPVKSSEDFYVGWNVETIFSYKDYMYMGTPTGMLIYSVADPLKPERMASITHILGCDPVVVENDVAYVTIHSGNFCGQNSKQLLIYNVKDPKQPKHIVSYEMKNPKGLGIDNGTLFLCDEGLKVFNASNPLTIMDPANLLAHDKGMDGFDLIAYEKTLMMIATDGIYQYDYTDLKNIKPLSKISIGN